MRKGGIVIYIICIIVVIILLLINKKGEEFDMFYKIYYIIISVFGFDISF